MSEFGDLKVSETSVKAITQGLKAAIGELQELDGFGSEPASLQGAGFGGMAMSGLEAGDGGLADSFEDFCERWEWGVRALVGDANVLADKLGLAAGMVWEQDQYTAGSWKVGVNAMFGNPHATEEEAAKQSYGDILKPDAPETAAERQKEFDQIKRDWNDTGRAVTSEGIGGALTDVGMDGAGIPEEGRERALDEKWGPSPEERAEQQGSPKQSRGDH
ncbi:MAG: hypothetical protein ACRDP3_14780 [Streptomyces sp.]|uniref:hypothetical protein n=1 Tax=Streptomyces sp. TaxID=1931 RepID=UPI003D6AC5DA